MKGNCFWRRMTNCGPGGVMEGLERLIGRSIGGKVTTSVKMERTTHSKWNAQASTFLNVLLEVNTQLCIAKIWAALQRTILILESIGRDKNYYGMLKSFRWSMYSTQMKNLRWKFRLRTEVCLQLPLPLEICVVEIKLWFMWRLMMGW